MNVTTSKLCAVVLFAAGPRTIALALPVNSNEAGGVVIVPAGKYCGPCEPPGSTDGKRECRTIPEATNADKVDEAEVLTTESCTVAGFGSQLSLTWAKLPSCKASWAIDPLPERRFIGMAPAEKFDGSGSGFDTGYVNNWFPVSGYTETLCGRVADYHYYAGPEKAERDWCLYMTPGQGFENIFWVPAMMAALPFDTADDLSAAVFGGWPQCAGSSYCVESEVTAAWELQGTPWFPEVNNSPLVNHDVCVHGPWVTEWVHGSKPEIHPTELIWWEDAGGASATDHWFALLLDASHRFDDPGRFDTTSYPNPFGLFPSDVSFNGPWAKGPLTRTVSVPLTVTVDAAGKPTSSWAFTILPYGSKGVVEAKFDPDDGISTTHLLRLDGAVVAKITEPEGAPRKYGAWFDGVCKESSTSIRGMVRVATTIDGASSFNVFDVRQAPIASPELAPIPVKGLEFAKLATPHVAGAQAAATADAAMDDSTVQLESASSGKRVTALFRFPSTRADAPKSWRVREVGAGGKQLSPSISISNGEATFRAPVGGAEGMEVVDEDTGAVIARANTGVTKLSVVLESATATLSDKGSTVPQAQFASLKLPFSLPTDRGVDVAEWRLRVVPRYSGAKRGRAAPEESTQLSRILNTRLWGKDAGARVKLFGTPDPVTVRWSFEARDVATGKAVAVVEASAPSANAVTYALGGAKSFPVQASIRFPKGRLILVRATAEATDPVGGSASSTQYVWSAGIRPDEADKQLRDQAIRRGASRHLVEQVWGAKSAKGQWDSGVRRTHTALTALRVAHAKAAKDDVITPDEMWRMLRMLGMRPAP